VRAGDGFDVEVQVSHYSADRNDAVLQVAKDISNAGALLERLHKTEKLLRQQEEETRLARAKVPPAQPMRLLDVGTVRFDESGRLWVMNKRESGWASFGICLDDWDNLFRQFNVKVTGHGVDGNGPWWAIESMSKAVRA
jgi:hypothetical protein